MPALASLADVCFDCPDASAMAAFYKVLGGGEVTYDDGTYASVTLDGGTVLNFGTQADHRAPTWPDGEVPQQIHLDFHVDDLDKAEAVLREHGAGKPEHQPDAGKWRVLTDPAGHPFCICRRP
jgi:uncharacterized glyoxalase superfamily protein PhnB